MRCPKESYSPHTGQKILASLVAARIPFSITKYLFDNKTTKAVGDKDDIASCKFGFCQKAGQYTVAAVCNSNSIAFPICFCSRESYKPKADPRNILF